MIVVETEEAYVEPYDIAHFLAPKMAKVCPDTTFVIEGSSELDWYMDFQIVYDDKKITYKSSDWYDSLNMNCCSDYEEFCEYYCTDDGNPIFSQEEYQSFSQGDWFYMKKEQKAVLCVPLTNVIEIDAK